MMNKLWDEIKKLNPQEVNTLCQKRFILGLCYSSEDEKMLLEDFLFRNCYKFAYGNAPKIKQATKEDRDRASDFIFYISSENINEKSLKKCTVLISSITTQQSILSLGYTPYTVNTVDDNELKKRIMQNNNDCFYALSYHFIGLRNIACVAVYTAICAENALWALGTAAPNIVPGPHQVVTAPIEAVSDFAVLTLNEIRLAFMLAGLCGESVGYIQQIDDIALILGLGSTAKVAATNAVGKAPGAGPIIKAAVSYAFTWAISETLLFNQMTGKKVTRKFVLDLYKKLFNESLVLVKQIAASRKQNLPPVATKIHSIND